jgi:hypothetical protein
MAEFQTDYDAKGCSQRSRHGADAAADAAAVVVGGGVVGGNGVNGGGGGGGGTATATAESVAAASNSRVGRAITDRQFRKLRLEQSPSRLRRSFRGWWDGCRA